MIRQLLLASTALVSACVLLAAFGEIAGAQQETTPAAPVAVMGVDPDIEGNTATSIGTPDVCATLGVGESRQIDFFVKGVADRTEEDVEDSTPRPVGGLAGFDFYFVYNAASLRVTGVDVEQMLASAPGSNVLTVFSDPVPSEGGNYHAAAADFGTNADESGDGVLARLTVEGIAPSTSELTVAALILDDSNNRTYDVDEYTTALLAVGGDCPSDATRPPAPTPAPTPVPETPGPTGQSSSPGASGEPGRTLAPGESPQPTRTLAPGETAAPTTSGNSGGTVDEGDGGGGSGWVIAAVAVAAVAAIGGAGGYLLLRRRNRT